MKMNLILVFIVTLIHYNNCSPIETNCTRVKSIDGSIGVDCVHTRKASDPFEPVIIEEHFVDLSRAKRASDEPNDAPVETELPEMFIQNLAVMNEANMSDCMNRVNCEEKCHLVAQRVSDNIETVDLEGFPEFVRNYYEAGKRGIDLGRNNKCSECQKLFNNCKAMQYEYTVKTNALYNELAQKNVSLFDDSNEQIPPEIAYLHHSMRFLDLANLSRCYARVSCESTCLHVKSNPNTEAPTLKSPLLQNDPHKPQSVDIIHEGAILGYTLAFNGLCDTCARHYADCEADKYAIAHMSSIIFD